jgi:two-component system, HptB-dependent secretion and biofilm response regulator
MTLKKSHTHHILVVDDDVILNGLFCSFLESKGMIAHPVFSLKEAVAFLSVKETIDLVLLDYQLGDGLGMELLEQEVFSDYKKSPPVIMISSNEDPDFLERCFDGGVSDYVIKPVNLSLLSLKVKSLLSSLELHNLVLSQKQELEKYKRDSQREEAIAKFTYEYILRQNNNEIPGVYTWLKSYSSFSGDMTLARLAPNGNLYFMLADATGHGLSAAITIMPVVSIFNSMVSKGFHIQQIVTEINKKVLRDSPDDRFVAAIVIELHREKGELSVWNGGMPTAYWHSDGELLREFASRNMAFGILEDDLFEID